MQKVNLCESCSGEKGVNDPTGFALADLLLGMGAAQEHRACTRWHEVAPCAGLPRTTSRRPAAWAAVPATMFSPRAGKHA